MKKNKLPSLVSILILTLLTAIVWISLSVYRVFTTKPSESVPSTVSEPLTPTLDQDTIKQIESSVFINTSEIPEIVTGNLSSPAPIPTFQTPLPTPTPITTPIASPSAVP